MFGADIWIASLLSGRRQIYLPEQGKLAGGVNWLLLKPVILPLHAAGALPALTALTLSEDDINESSETLSLPQAKDGRMHEIS